jgi:MFS family permease
MVAALLIFAGLRPDPRDIGRELARAHPESVRLQATRSLPDILRDPGVLVAMVTMVFAQLVMNVPMSITSVHMTAHQHPLTAVSVVISAHTLGMFAFSMLTGRMTDRWGRTPVIILGCSTMILSCALAAPSSTMLPLIAALFLLGLGWNFAYVAGSTLLADQLSPDERSVTQGVNDLVLNLASGISQLGSGVIYAGHGYGVMAIVAAAAALVPLAAAIWWHAAGPPKALAR